MKRGPKYTIPFASKIKTVEDLRIHCRAEESECWIWRNKSGSLLTEASRYGIVYLGGGRGNKVAISPHALAWRIANRGNIPDGMVIMHACDTPGCCNPSHLETGTQADNILDSVRKGRFCVKKPFRCGHLRTPDNSVPGYSGRGRRCRICLESYKISKLNKLTEAISMISSGFSVYEVATKIEVSTMTVYRWLKKHRPVKMF